jgi:hypothetical protein
MARRAFYSGGHLGFLINTKNWNICYKSVNGWTNGRTDGQGDCNIAPTLWVGGIIFHITVNCFESLQNVYDIVKIILTYCLTCVDLNVGFYQNVVQQLVKINRKMEYGIFRMRWPKKGQLSVFCELMMSRCLASTTEFVKFWWLQVQRPVRHFGKIRHSNPHMLNNKLGLSLLYTDTKLPSHCIVVTDLGSRFFMSQKTARPLKKQ